MSSSQGSESTCYCLSLSNKTMNILTTEQGNLLRQDMISYQQRARSKRSTLSRDQVTQRSAVWVLALLVLVLCLEALRCFAVNELHHCSFSKASSDIASSYYTTTQTRSSLRPLRGAKNGVARRRLGRPRGIMLLSIQLFQTGNPRFPKA
jgi:hypothetical protein